MEADNTKPEAPPEAPTTTIDNYFQQYGKFHVAKATELLEPLHKPGVDELPKFEHVLRQPFEPQAHVIAAAMQMLTVQQRGVIVGEMGTGKTLMGMLSVHEHAKLSARKGGRNGNYRAIILCPDHLIKKWKDELEETIGGVKVHTFDAAGKGQSHLIGEMVALYEELRDPQSFKRNKRWKKPVGANWYVLGRNQAKFLPTRQPKAMRRMTLVAEEDTSTVPPTINKYPVRVDRCPTCGLPYKDKKGRSVQHITGGKNILKCESRWNIAMPDPDRKDCGLDCVDLRHPTDHPTDRPGRIVEADDRRWKIHECGTPLWQFTRTPKRWPPGIFFAQQLARAFHYIVVDEVHEQKSEGAAQALACAKLIASIGRCLALTGTLVGGYARDLFPLLFRFSPGDLVEEGFKWGGWLDFTREYGRIEEIHKTTVTADGDVKISYGSQSMRKDRDDTKVTPRPAPGIMPALFGQHLLDKTLFMSLEEMASGLPTYTEYVGGESGEGDEFYEECAVSMEPAQEAAYQDLEGTLVSKCRDMLIKGDMRLLGTMLIATLEYADRPWEWTAPTGKPEDLACGFWEKPKSRTPDNWRGVIQPQALPQDIIYPKEQALLNICQREIRAGNQVWVYCKMTNKRDVQPRLKKLLNQIGLRVAILRSTTVVPKKRLRWIEDNGPGVDVIISHNELVKTGVDFFGKKPGSHNFNSIVFYETGYSVLTLRQAARRAWRIGQSKDCRVYYLHYRGTMQARAMDLISRKMAASLAVDGKLNAEGLAAMTDDGSAAMALARSISNSIDENDIRRNWAKVSASLPSAKIDMSWLNAGIESLEADPFDELDLLPMEAGLLAQTMLDHEEQTGLSRDMLVRMAAEFFDYDEALV